MLDHTKSSSGGALMGQHSPSKSLNRLTSVGNDHGFGRANWQIEVVSKPRLRLIHALAQLSIAGRSFGPQKPLLGECVHARD